MKLQLHKVNKEFTGGGKTHFALQDISLDVSEGEFVCIVGPSGCGKTTILNLLSGLEKPTTGTVNVEGKVGLMFQEAGLFPWLTVRKNVEFGLKMQNIPAQEREEKIQHYLRMVHLEQFADAYPHELSGGMKQRVALARTLIIEPDILLMDEPFAALDAQTREHLYTELQQIWQMTKKTVVFITHDIREAVCLGDRVVVMSARPGKIQREFPVSLSYPRDITSVEIAEISKQVRAEIQSHQQVNAETV